MNIDLLMKPIPTSKYKNRQIEKNNRLKIQKKISMENNIDSNNNNLSSSFSNINNQNENNFRKFSGYNLKKNMENNEIKEGSIRNIKIPRYNSNSNKVFQADYKKHINILSLKNYDSNSKNKNNSNTIPNENKSYLKCYFYYYKKK